MNSVFNSLEKGKYKFISLGYSCNVGMDLGLAGLRESSYPFDWLLSSYSGVIDCIKNNFSDFLSEQQLFQSKKEPWKYLNKKYHFWFQHDFTETEPFDSQIQKIKEKYDRRCERFLKLLNEKCIFFRYIHNQDDVDFIVENKKNIEDALHIDNKNRIIVYLAGKKGINYKGIWPIFYSKSGINNSVGKHPIFDDNDLLTSLIELSSIDKSKLKENKKHYQKNRIKPFKKYCLSFKRKVELATGHFYKHTNIV